MSNFQCQLFVVEGYIISQLAICDSTWEKGPIALKIEK